MRVSRARAAENRERILDVATRLFRERGIDGIGVADLMKSAGLTHGGFYGHFKSKDDLVAQACGRAVQKMRDNWIKVLDQTSGDPVHALANIYLAAKHRDNAGRGCTVAALGSEIARQSTAVRHNVTEELKPFIDYLSAIVQGNSASLRRERAIALYASLVGALVIARAVDDAAFSNEVLHAVANFVRSTSTASKPRRKIANPTPRTKKA
ncbi:TetR/AcrR family transcriptional regulator [Tunturiibacter gelidiferens]|uniref:TetR/AcrR family transcriptional regulator n=1 Tax=Tunturiibacter gelidiferens TaxID=3069689 RepID=UPI003D9B234C